MKGSTGGGRRIRGLLKGTSCVLVAGVAALALSGFARAQLIVGVNDSAPLDPSLLSWFYPTMGTEGLKLDTLTIRWDDTQPTVIEGQAQVAAAVSAAAANGVTIELDLYPLHSMVFTNDQKCAPSSDPQACGNTTEIDAFATWTAQVAQAFPTVHEFVVMNECNQDLFINPQWNSAGQNQSAEICGRALVASYDAIKAVSSQDFVWGVGLSPRGNDNPAATSDSSTSPVAFLQDLGTWFKAYAAATGRTKPLMDGFDFHPYPIPQSLPFASGYADQNDATVSNLARIYQAFYDGFNGSPQPTIGQQQGGGLPVSLNEVGIQTDETGVAGYTGVEDDGISAPYTTQSYQATWYVEMLNLVACDPNVELVNIFHLIDETDLAGWQSGLYDVNENAKQAAGAVHDWIASTGGKCQGAMHPWTPSGVAASTTTSTTTTTASAATAATTQRILVATGGQIRVFNAGTYALKRVIDPFPGYSGALAVAIVDSGGVDEVAVGEGSGGQSLVKVYNGKTWAGIGGALRPFGAFTGGVSLAFGTLGAKGREDLIVGSGAGMTAEVKVYPTSGPGLVEQLTPFGASFRGGVSVAAGALGGGGGEDLIVGSGAGMAAQVRVYAGATDKLVETLSPFAKSFQGGISVAAGGLLGTKGDDLVVGTGPGIEAIVKAYLGATAVRLWSVDALGAKFTGGVSVATVSPTAGTTDVVVGAGSGGGAQVKVLSGSKGKITNFFTGATGSNAIAVAGG